MQLKPITKKNFKQFYNLLSEDFCFEEHKTFEDMIKDLDNPRYKPNFIYSECKKIGYITFWDMDDFYFFEHFAVLKNLRDQGYGSRFISEFFPTLNKPAFIEVERPINELTTRRVEFYKRNDFVVNDFDYYQPSYHGADDKVPMRIVSYKKSISKKEYNYFINKIKEHVYNIQS